MVQRRLRGLVRFLQGGASLKDTVVPPVAHRNRGGRRKRGDPAAARKASTTQGKAEMRVKSAG